MASALDSAPVAATCLSRAAIKSGWTRTISGLPLPVGFGPGFFLVTLFICEITIPLQLVLVCDTTITGQGEARTSPRP